jgi:hypothetical protein
MKKLLKFLVIPVACCALVCSQAMAKKEKSDDSDNNKKKSEQSTTGKSTASSSSQSRKSDSGGKVQQQESRQKENYKPQQSQKPIPQQTRKKDPEPSKKAVKPREDKPAPKPAVKKDVRPAKDDPPAKRQDNDQAGKGGTKEATREKPSKGGKPMDLPGKGPGADNGHKSTKDKITKAKDGKDNKPMDLPGKRPATADGDKSAKDKIAKAKDNKPNKPMTLPGKRPKVPVADKDRTPERRPEIAKRDKKADLPATAKKRKAEPRKQVVVRPGQNTKQVRRPDMERNTTNNNWWSSNTTRKDVRINNVTNVTNVTNVNNNFRQNVNWSTRRHHWGYNPWWNRPAVRPWYGSSWNGGWSPTYYRRHYHYGHYAGYRPPGYYHDDNDVAQAIGWGLIGWSLGAMIYDTGYRSYHNPYPVRPVYVSRDVQVTYTEPITQVAVRSAPADDAVVEEITRKSESLIVESQTAFKQRNYLVALELADKAIAESPGDGALHEYRALILFALGKYGEAAGVLNPVLASGPGWDWATMIALYDAQQTYTDQLQRLEAYTEEKPDAADTHFLLGYHYMVCGHLDLATPQFDLAHKLMPSDSVSKELAELTRNSAKSSDEEQPAEAEPEAEETPEPEPVPLEKLTGTWVAARDAGSSITLSFMDDGKYTWSYMKDGKTTGFSGEYSINDDGQLVLDAEESQMVASVELPQETELKFVLAGGPPADPGLTFKKN